MSYPLGRLRGIRACASERGTFAVLALDHRQNLRHELRPTDPTAVTYDEMVAFKQAVVRRLAPGATGVLLDPEIGAAQCLADGSLPTSTGLLVAIEATGYEGPSTDRVSRVLDGWSVGQAKRMGADAAKLLIYYHPDAPGAAHQERLVAEVAAACVAADLALFVEPLGFSLDPATPKLLGEERRRVVVETARRLRARSVGMSSRPSSRTTRASPTRGGGRRPVRNSTPRPRCRGYCCPVAWTTPRSSARSASRVAPAPVASWSDGPVWAPSATMARRRPRCLAGVRGSGAAARGWRTWSPPRVDRGMHVPPH